MLSRVAEAVYWMGRYIERAEDLTRLLAVNFNALLETQPESARHGWQPLVRMTGDEDLFCTLYGEANAQTVSEFMLWHPQNPNAVVTCVTRARENARSAREQISSEMWEQLNRLYFLVRDASRPAVLSSPSQFFQQVRDGSQAFQGITTATLTHNEPYQFIQLGLHLERADKTARILDAKYLALSRLEKDSVDTALQLIALLRSCSAFEPYRRASNGELVSQAVVQYLLLDPDFPRAVFYCLIRSLHALQQISGESVTPTKPDHPLRTLGRIRADLEYMDQQDMLGEKMDPFLTRLMERLNGVGVDIVRTFFSTRVILPEMRPQQQQQQQQSVEKPHASAH
jgi:uncharacterized alpha-E superfamily protein